MVFDLVFPARNGDITDNQLVVKFQMELSHSGAPNP